MATATAVFNTNIETPGPLSRPNSYDLNTVITKEGFGDNISFEYRLDELIEGVSLLDNQLNVYENAYGKISITVSIPKSERDHIKATATTKLYGFYAARLEFFNNTALKKAIETTKKDWPSLVGGADR